MTSNCNWIKYNGYPINGLKKHCQQKLLRPIARFQAQQGTKINVQIADMVQQFIRSARSKCN